MSEKLLFVYEVGRLNGCSQVNRMQGLLYQFRGRHAVCDRVAILCYEKLMKIFCHKCYFSQPEDVWKIITADRYLVRDHAVLSPMKSLSQRSATALNCDQLTATENTVYINTNKRVLNYTFMKMMYSGVYDNILNSTFSVA